MERTLLDDSIVVLPWTEERVEALLAQYGLGTERACAGCHKELTQEVAHGGAKFGQRGTGAVAELAHLVDVVVLHCASPDGRAVLVRTACSVLGTSCSRGDHLPRSVRRPDEDLWGAARRIARTQIGLLDGSMFVEEVSGHVVEEEIGAEQPDDIAGLSGLRSRRRTVVVFAWLLPGDGGFRSQLGLPEERTPDPQAT